MTSQPTTASAGLVNSDPTSPGRLTSIRTKEFLTDNEAADLVDHLIRPYGHHAERIAQEQLWMRCVAYYAGKQHFLQDGVQLREPTNLPKHRVLYKANKMLGNILRAVAKINTLSWMGSVAPRSDDPMDMYQAELSDKIALHIQDVTDHETVRMYVLLWSAVCGVGFTRLRWDPDAGDADRFYLEDDSDMVAVMLSDSEKRRKEQMGRFKDLYPGEIAEDVESPFKVFHDWSSRERGVAGCSWMASVTYLPVEEAADVWEMDPADISREEPRLGPLWYEDSIAFLSTGRGGLNPSIPTPREKAQERARIVEYFEVPKRRNKGRGRHIVMVGRKVIRNGENFFRATGFGLPWTKWDWIPMVGRFWGLGLGEQLLNPQFNYNRARASIIEHQNVFGSPATYVPEGSGIPTGTMTTAPGSIHAYNPSAGPIVFGQAPKLAREVAENAIMCASDMQEISFNTDPDASKLPAQIRSGAGLRAMMEEKHLALHPTASGALKAEHRSTKMALSLAQINYTEGRLLKYQGNNGAWVIKHFRGIDINTDLRMTTDPTRFQSIAAIQAEILDLVQVGAIDPLNDPEDRAAMREAIHYNIGRDVMAEKTREGMNQSEEIEKIKSDPMRYAQENGFPVNVWDDHAEHARVTKRFLRSGAAKELDPVTLELVVRHWQQHDQIVQQAIIQNMQAMASLRGNAAQKGKASQPQSV